MASITRFSTLDDYDPLHTLLNRPVAEIEELITALEDGNRVDRTLYLLSREVQVAPILVTMADFAPTEDLAATRRGDVTSISVSVSVKVAGFLNSSTPRVLATLPSQFRPTATRFLTARHVGSSGGIAPVEISSAGLIRIRNYSIPAHVAGLTVEFSDTFVSPGDYIGA